MSLLSNYGWSVACLLLAFGGCVKADNVENDEGASSEESADTDSPNTRRDAGTSTTRRDAGSGSTRSDAGGDTDDDEGTADGDEDSSDDDDDTMSLPDGGTGGGRDAGSAPMVDISGSAAENNCTSTMAAADGMCSSHFCGITAEQLGAAMDPDSPCGTPEQACEQGGTLAKKVTDCSVEEKSKINNLGKTNEQLRPLVQACVYRDAEIKESVGEQCLGCFLDVAECAGEKCLTECLVGTAAQCDACRITNGCEEPLFACAGLPNPL